MIQFLLLATRFVNFVCQVKISSSSLRTTMPNLIPVTAYRCRLLKLYGKHGPHVSEINIHL